MKKFIIPLLLVSSILVSCNKNISENHEELYKSYIRNTDINKENLIKNVILFIGDGMGLNHIEAAEIYAEREMTFSNESDSSWTFHGYCNTDSLTSSGFKLDESKSLLDPALNPSLYDDNPSPYGSGGAASVTPYTDSAAAGTAIATGIKVTNSRLSKDVFGKNLTTLVEIAHGLNKKSGVITTDTLAGATPSAFLAHADERHMTDEIIESASNSPANLIIAKTLSNWTTKYESMYKNNGFDNICYDEGSLNIDADKEVCLLPSILPLGDRTVSLADLTAYALDKLDNDNGFFLMIEGANIDKQAHSNQPLATINELLGMDEAVKTAQLWADCREDTIIIVTADHETGALTFDENSTSNNIIENMRFLSYNHSRTRVSVDVYGDISDFTTKYKDKFETLEGKTCLDNTDIFKLCASYL